MLIKTKLVNVRAVMAYKGEIWLIHCACCNASVKPEKPMTAPNKVIGKKAKECCGGENVIKNLYTK